MPPALTIALPAWATARVAGIGPLTDDEACMRLVLELAGENWRRGTGGPFAAAVIGSRTGALVAAGVNLVVPSRAAPLHAEVVAVALAGQVVGTYDLDGGDEPTALVSSTEPCAMCYGAVVWSGVRRLVCGATDADARGIGFDEGPKLADWQTPLRRRGVEVVEGVLRAEAAEVLRAYGASGGEIYNA